MIKKKAPGRGPGGYVRENVGDKGGRRQRERNEELNIISVQMISETVTFQNRAERRHVNIKKKRTKDGTLGDTRQKRNTS